MDCAQKAEFCPLSAFRQLSALGRVLLVEKSLRGFVTPLVAFHYKAQARYAIKRREDDWKRENGAGEREGSVKTEDEATGKA